MEFLRVSIDFTFTMNFAIAENKSQSLQVFESDAQEYPETY